MKNTISKSHLFLAPVAIVALLFTATAYAAAPGITGTSSNTSFNLTAVSFYLNQPDGATVYAWGYGCTTTPSSSLFVPANITTAKCPALAGQVPGPTLVVTEGVQFTVTLNNGLPPSAGNTSILFPGMTVVSTTGGVAGLLTQEAQPAGCTASGCNSVTYTLSAPSPGTRAYYSGTQSDLQVEMGLYGAIIALPATPQSACSPTTPGTAAYDNLQVEGAHSEHDFRLANAAYDHPETCYDREYLFQFAEMDQNIHRQAAAQVAAAATACATPITLFNTPGCTLHVPTEPYKPSYFLINGRSMPDDMDANYAPEYPHQPYNGNPHMHPGEITLLRVIGQGRWQHPFHEHANHVRILARDGNLITSITSQSSTSYLAGPLQFTTTTTPGLAFDGLFYFTGKGLNWDMYGHNFADTPGSNAAPNCLPDANGYNTHAGGAPYSAINYYEWCQDHFKPVQATPLGDVEGGGPATLPDPNIFTNGAWYSGSPYLGPDATTRASGPTTNLQPSNIQANPAKERGWAFMWHSHNEREITTNNVFPGGMLMMMLVDSREFVIDESM